MDGTVPILLRADGLAADLGCDYEFWLFWLLTVVFPPFILRSRLFLCASCAVRRASRITIMHQPPTRSPCYMRMLRTPDRTDARTHGPTYPDSLRVRACIVPARNLQTLAIFAIAHS